MERRIDFSRGRRILCASRGHGLLVDLDWIDRLGAQAKEACRAVA